MTIVQTQARHNIQRTDRKEANFIGNYINRKDDSNG